MAGSATCHCGSESEKLIKSIEDCMMPVYPEDFVKLNNCSLSSYTYEDYIKDFELDYLGFDRIPDKPATDLCSVDISSSDDRKESSKSNEIQTHKP